MVQSESNRERNSRQPGVAGEAGGATFLLLFLF